jgi:hypothetical protein
MTARAGAMLIETVCGRPADHARPDDAYFHPATPFR